MGLKSGDLVFLVDRHEDLRAHQGLDERLRRYLALLGSDELALEVVLGLEVV
ncbi:MAG: hypothetical protein WAM94_00765 [Chromatiaceae bacterium]